MNSIALPTNIRPVHWIKQRMDLFYPMIIEQPNLQIQQQMNNIILKNINEMNKQQGYHENPQTTITAGFEEKTNQRNILSLMLINYAFSGGAHGMTLQRSLTFNTKTGKLYQLKDLFKPGSDYVKVLSENVAKQIKQRDIFTFEEFKAIKPDQDFYIADKSLVLYYQLYELTAYAYGFPYFPISVYDIQDIVEEDGPLGVMMY